MTSENKTVVSIIIPAYNAEATIRDCLDSVCKQTFSQIEAIVVDDGSKDQTAAIAAEIGKSDQRIRLIRKQNQGVSIARNTGIEHAVGDYLLFLDADDFLADRCVECLLNSMNSCNSDIAMGKSANVNADTKAVRYKELVGDADKCSREPSLVSGILGYTFSEGIPYCSQAKLFKKSIIMENEIRYEVSLSVDEDVHFNLMYFSFCETISVVDETVAFFSIYEGGQSLTHSYSRARIDVKYDTYQRFISMFQAKGILNDEMRGRLNVRFLSSIWDTVYRIFAGKYSNIPKDKRKEEANYIIMKSCFHDLIEIKRRVRKAYGKSAAGAIAWVAANSLGTRHVAGVLLIFYDLKKRLAPR